MSDINTKSKIKIGDVETFSIVDFPDTISAVVFMQGCPWRCPFCYNKILQNQAQESNVNWPKFLEFLQKRKGVLEGVVFSGGEPLLQDKDLEMAIDDVKAIGYKVGLHTGGFYPEALQKIVKKTDWVGLDIKAPLKPKIYKDITGGRADVKKVIESLNILIASKVHFECRTTCDPRFLGINDIYEIAEYLHKLGVQEYYLQKYRPVDGDTTSEDEVNKFFNNFSLQAYLHNIFPIFESRK